MMNLKILILIAVIIFASGVNAGCSDGQVDINSASIEELETITWIGPATAQKIVESRPFESIDDLDRVKGIGETKLKDIEAEGIACVGKEESEEEEKEDIEKEEDEEVVNITFGESNNNYKENDILTEDKENEPIMLNSAPAEKELIYESRNAKMMRYLPYAFSLFLIFVIVAILIDKQV